MTSPNHLRQTLRVLLMVLAFTLALLPRTTAQAHPLGNFTVNRYSRIELSGQQISIRYVEDTAEIPTFQAMSNIDLNHDGVIGEDERKSYATARLALLNQHVQLTLAGLSVPLRPESAEMQLLPGQAGLQTMRLTGWLRGEVTDSLMKSASGRLNLAFRDENEPDRIGWREIVVRGDKGDTIESSSVSATDLSDELRSYPTDLLSAPLDRRDARATVLVRAGTAQNSVLGGSNAISRANPLPDPATALLDRFASLSQLVAAGRLGPAAIAVALLLAAVWGAVHALSPGHGKTIVAAYLVGSRGTPWHALYLGLTVTATHTIGIYALGLITLFASRFILPETLYPWLSLASGLAVVVIGLVMVVGRYRGYRSAAAPGNAAHVHADASTGDLVAAGQVHDAGMGPCHDHHAEHGHSHGPDGHTHLPPGADGKPVTWRSLLALGIAGGLLPCPSALVLLLGAIAIGQVAFGLVLVVAFSFGLAFLLTAIGVAMVYTGRLASRAPLGRFNRKSRLLTAAPIASALVISVIGLVMTADALRQMGLI